MGHSVLVSDRGEAREPDAVFVGKQGLAGGEALDASHHFGILEDVVGISVSAEEVGIGGLRVHDEVPLRAPGGLHGIDVADTGADRPHLDQLLPDLRVLGGVLRADPLVHVGVDLGSDDARGDHQPFAQLLADEAARLLVEEAAGQGQDDRDGQHEDHHQLGLKAPAPGRGQGRSSLRGDIERKAFLDYTRLPPSAPQHFRAHAR
ncbi:hypothetical protein D3C72_1025300 [compost metagenome]